MKNYERTALQFYETREISIKKGTWSLRKDHLCQLYFMKVGKYPWSRGQSPYEMTICYETKEISMK